MNDSQLYTDITSRLDGVRSRENMVEFVSGLLLSTIVAIGIVLAVVILEQLFSFGVTGRTLMAIAAIIGISGSLAWLCGPPVLRMARIRGVRSDEEIAHMVGRHFTGIRDRLLDALQMYTQKDSLGTIYSPELIDASFADLHASISSLDFNRVVDTGRVRTVRRYALSAAGLFILVFVVSPSGFLGSLNRVMHFGTSYAASLPAALDVTPGNVEIVRGEDVRIAIRVSGGSQGEPELLTRTTGAMNFEPAGLQRTAEGEYVASLRSLKQSTEYYAAVGEISSEKFRISVLDRPLIRSLRLRVVPPAYTGLPAAALEENTGDVSAYPGSRIEMHLVSNKTLDSASIILADSMTIPLRVSAAEAAGALTVRNDLQYRFALRDIDGLTNVDPIRYTVRVVQDEYPSVEILSPGQNLDITEEMKLPLIIGIKDDFGYTKLRLAYRLAHSRYEQAAEEFSFIDIPFPVRTRGSLQVPFAWDLGPLHLVPEDAVAYYAEVFDNDIVNGPKSARSEMYIVRLPSIDEVFKDVAETQQQSLESMQQVAKEAEQLRKDLDDVQRELRKNTNKSDWQQQQKAENMAQRFEAMKKKLEDASRNMDEMLKQAQDNKLMSEKTLEKYMEMQKLMEQLKSPELQKALQKLQESMKKMTPEQMRQAMEQMQFNEDQFRQNLERTIELLKRIAIEQKIDEVIKRTEELKRMQADLRAQTAKSQDPSEREQLAQQQEDLQKQMDALERETAELRDKMEEFAKEMPMEQMESARKSLQKNQIGSKMKKSTRSIQQGEMQEAGEEQKQSEDALEEFQDEMEQVRSALQSQQQKEIVNALKKQMQNLVELSKRQEELKSEAQALDQNSPQFRNQAQEQNEIADDLGNVAQAMSEIAKKSFAVSPEMGKEIGNALNQMSNAMQEMQNRNPGGTSSSQSQAMGSLNRAAMLTQGALNAMMQGGQSGGMGMAGLMGRLGQMSGMQGSINQGTKQAMGMGQGQGMSPQQQAEYGRLAGAQAAVQKSLEELAREAKNAGEFSKLLGDLDKIAQEMTEVQTNLQQGDVNPETLEKQERILSRLLDSQRSARERDYEKRRKAEPGKEYERARPGEIDLTTQEGKNRLRQELLKVLEGAYSRDYEDLIRKYFEQLEKEETAQPR